jgi:Bacteriophage T4-like portal protein (Gp20)
MAWYNKNLESTPNSNTTAGKAEYLEAVNLTQTQLQDLGDRFGFDIKTTDKGSFAEIPSTIVQNSDFKNQFMDFWLGGVSDKQTVEQRRKIRNSAYYMMDEILGEAILTLDTFADEALGVGFIDEPIDITFSDESIGEKVMNILDRNSVITHSRGHVRNLIKWGDLGARILTPKEGSDPEKIVIKMVTPDKWEAFFTEQHAVATAYSMNPSFGNTTKNKEKDLLQPWEFVQFSVPDTEFAPYGRGQLEPMRTNYEQLITIEALLALSRASRVERLVVSVPVKADNPTAAMSKLNHFKQTFKNSIFNDNVTGKKSFAKTPAMQDTLFIPSDEGYDIKRLTAGSGVEISSVDDVEHFRDKVLMMSSLSKGYLLADESTDRYHALAAQDLKFSRKLIAYQNAYATGLTKLCLILAGYCGADLQDIEIIVKIKRPVQLSDQLLNNYKQMSDDAASFIDNYRRTIATAEEVAEPDYLPKDTYAKLLAYFGAPEEIVSMFTVDEADDAPMPINSPTNDINIANIDSPETILSSTISHKKQSIKERSGKKLKEFLETRELKDSVKVSSKSVYRQNIGLFELLNSPQEANQNKILIEVLNGPGNIKPIVGKGSRLRVLTESKQKKTTEGLHPDWI